MAKRFSRITTGGVSDRHLREAEARAGGIYRDRVAFVRAGLSFTALVIEVIEAMEGYWEAPDEAIAARVRANWKAMEELCEENPHAINWGPLRPSTARMIGLHPDHPNPRRKRAQVKDLDQN